MDPHNIMGRLSKYIVEAGDKSLPEAVSEGAKNHILDTIAAMVSGSRLRPGEFAYRDHRGAGEGAVCARAAISAFSLNGNPQFWPKKGAIRGVNLVLKFP